MQVPSTWEASGPTRLPASSGLSSPSSLKTRHPESVATRIVVTPDVLLRAIFRTARCPIIAIRTWCSPALPSSSRETGISITCVRRSPPTMIRYPLFWCLSRWEFPTTRYRKAGCAQETLVLQCTPSVVPGSVLPCFCRISKASSTGHDPCRMGRSGKPTRRHHHNSPHAERISA